jgi:dTDP-4-dehydrorhamnose 3,5-epimerase
VRITPTRVPDVQVIDPVVHGDARGYFMETWRADTFAAAGIHADFRQDALSHSVKGTLRGLHYQVQNTQGKLIRVARGEIYDVAVDLRRSSATFGCWTGERLSASNRRGLWIPPGFAHGFYVLADAEILYKLTDVHSPEYERRVRWNDPDLAIDWPIDSGAPMIVSEKDTNGFCLGDAPTFP